MRVWVLAVSVAGEKTTLDVFESAADAERAAAGRRGQLRYMGAALWKVEVVPMVDAAKLEQVRTAFERLDRMHPTDTVAALDEMRAALEDAA